MGGGWTFNLEAVCCYDKNYNMQCRVWDLAVGKGLKGFKGPVNEKKEQCQLFAGDWGEDYVCYVGASCLTKPSLEVTWKMKGIIYKFLNLAEELCWQHTELFLWLAMMTFKKTRKELFIFSAECRGTIKEPWIVRFENKLLSLASPSKRFSKREKDGFRAKIKDVSTRFFVKALGDLRWHFIDGFRQTNILLRMPKADVLRDLLY